MKKSLYIASPLYDWIFIIGSPTVLFFVAIVISDSWITEGQLFPYMHSDKEQHSYLQIFMGTTLAAHFLLTFVRSHANPAIVKKYPYRFWLAPLLLMLGMMTSLWFLTAIAVITIFWDMWHSSQQTFGFGRIYDSKAGNPPELGRKLDMIMNFFIWSGPLLGGATLISITSALQQDLNTNADIIFTSIPAQAGSYHELITYIILSTSIPFSIYYLYTYYTYLKNGYKVSIAKTYLYISTALLSIIAWGFNSFGLAFFIMNFFHVVQYFAIMWHTEKANLLKASALDCVEGGKYILLFLFITIPLIVGFMMEMADTNQRVLFSLFLCISLLHYWYDGFMWSVRKKQV
jgi:hypothetical protein